MLFPYWQFGDASAGRSRFPLPGFPSLSIPGSSEWLRIYIAHMATEEARMAAGCRLRVDGADLDRHLAQRLDHVACLVVAHLLGNDLR